MVWPIILPSNKLAMRRTKTKGAFPGSVPIIDECQTAVQDQLIEHPTDVDVPVSCRWLMVSSLGLDRVNQMYKWFSESQILRAFYRTVLRNSSVLEIRSVNGNGSLPTPADQLSISFVRRCRKGEIREIGPVALNRRIPKRVTNDIWLPGSNALHKLSLFCRLG